MLPRVLGTLLGFMPIASALSGQVPVVDGVIGGVRSSGKTFSHMKLPSTRSSTPTPGKLRVVENSGVCETTPGVCQASGYGDLSSSKSIWFWFFEARSNHSIAPLVVWFNGGPGASSMIGLFQEHGPCRITNDSSDVVLNPNSWNNVANMLYIDQPVGVGFSYGTETVGTTQDAAKDIYQFLQIWYADSRYSKFAGNEFGIWTESYGGHYGPIFAAYFLRMNEAIASGTATGTTINLKYLGLGNSLTDPLNQYAGYITYAALNPYHPLVPSSIIESAKTSYYESGGCRSQIEACYNKGSDSVCSNAQSYCNTNILSPLAGIYDVYFVLAQEPDPYPPDLTNYLTSSSVTSKIGSQSMWEEVNYNIYDNFAETGDWMRNSAPDLATVINAGIRTIVYDGDADFILCYPGVEAQVAALNTEFSAQFAKTPFANWTVAGQLTGVYKNAGTFSYIRIFGAGHEVPAYTHGTLSYGQAALEMFTQIMSNNGLSST